MIQKCGGLGCDFLWLRPVSHTSMTVQENLLSDKKQILNCSLTQKRVTKLLNNYKLSSFSKKISP